MGNGGEESGFFVAGGPVSKGVEDPAGTKIGAFKNSSNCGNSIDVGISNPPDLIIPLIDRLVKDEGKVFFCSCEKGTEGGDYMFLLSE